MMPRYSFMSKVPPSLRWTKPGGDLAMMPRYSFTRCCKVRN